MSQTLFDPLFAAPWSQDLALKFPEIWPTDLSEYLQLGAGVEANLKLGCYDEGDYRIRSLVPL